MIRARIGDRLAAMPRFRRWAAAASLAWAVLVLGYGIGFLSAGTTATPVLDATLFLMALLLPLLLVWLAAWLAEELERQREIVAALAEAAAPLIAELAAARGAMHGRAPAATPEAAAELVADALRASRREASVPLDRLLAGQARMEVALQKLTLRRPAAPDPDPAPAAEPAAAPQPAAPPPAPPPPAPEPELPLMPADEPPARPGWPDVVRALDFPRDADDKAGFRALKVALRHHGLAQMLQAAEDVLNLLSEEGVFVDELPMAPVDAAAWRRFMAGRRGHEVAGLGGIDAPRALDAARALMRKDSIFRDSALFFQRRFDAVLGEFATAAGDAELAELAGTRSGRAFMLMARLSGSLD